ncbi:hypothetical protein AB0B50_14635 [Streptomyces sp. NPDC041068]|uniref:hypothetical protein n=1 Tax=Streptomyces sp. NPDC041068 TaxID=3155130 RepID=UPI0033D73B20
MTELERLGLRPKKLNLGVTVSPAVAARFLAVCEPTFLLLSFSPARLAPDVLASLRDLEGLSVVNVNEPWNLSLFPADAPLTFLGLVGSRSSVRDLHLMPRWTQLERVAFRTDGPDSAADRETLARLPRLTRPAPARMATDLPAHIEVETYDSATDRPAR